MNNNPDLKNDGIASPLVRNDNTHSVIASEAKQSQLLSLKNISKHFSQFSLNDISFDVQENEFVSIIGRSGCGKSTVAKIILKLIKPDSGSIIFKNEDVTEMESNIFKKYLTHFQIVFQNPYSSLNPKWKIKNILLEPVKAQKSEKYFDKKNETEFLKELLNKVLLNENLLDKYPNELSGGERQRVAICRAISVKPDIIIADEPTSSLDVTSEKNTLILLYNICKTEKITLLLITHSLTVAKYITHRCIVMDSGKIVEDNSIKNIIENPVSIPAKLLVQSSISMK